jgi:hypothetical protein
MRPLVDFWALLLVFDTSIANSDALVERKKWSRERFDDISKAMAVLVTKMTSAEKAEASRMQHLLYWDRVNGVKRPARWPQEPPCPATKQS